MIFLSCQSENWIFLAKLKYFFVSTKGSNFRDIVQSEVGFKINKQCVRMHKLLYVDIPPPPPPPKKKKKKKKKLEKNNSNRPVLSFFMKEACN